MHQCVHWGTYIQAPRRERAIDVQVTTEFSVSGTQDFVARGLCRRLLGPHMLQTHVLVVLSLVDNAGHGIQTPRGCSCDGPPGPTATPATYSRPFTSTRDLGCNSLSGRRDSNEAGGWMGDVPIRILFYLCPNVHSWYSVLFGICLDRKGAMTWDVDENFRRGAQIAVGAVSPVVYFAIVLAVYATALSREEGSKEEGSFIPLLSQKSFAFLPFCTYPCGVLRL